MNAFSVKNNCLIYRNKYETVRFESIGKGIRVQAYTSLKNPENDYALEGAEKGCGSIEIGDSGAKFTNCKVTAFISNTGKISFYNDKGELLFEEYVRNNRLEGDYKCSLKIPSRQIKRKCGENYHVIARFCAYDDEQIFGMGQYQQTYLDLKGCSLELAQRNSQASIPFMLSGRGYGFLWNNPAIGRVDFSKNVTMWEAYETDGIDYWVTADETPKKILENYAQVSGTVPLMPDYALGLWQCKLRYRTQEELLSVAREYKKRNLPISVIVADFFHWDKCGTWEFDKKYWPDVDGMVKELNDMGIKLMVSIWPTVEPEASTFEEIEKNGYLTRIDSGIDRGMVWRNLCFMDVTNEDARKYMWKKADENYYSKGIELFWLDVAEPEFHNYDFELYSYKSGSVLKTGNIYPYYYAKTYYDGLFEKGNKNVCSLIRCAWAGSQKFGSLLWSGDIDVGFFSFRNQVNTGLNVGIAGLPWWTTDIGGFHGGNAKDEDFIECLIRWYQYAVFSPVLRMHGNRDPRADEIGAPGEMGSGSPNEIWCYGEKAYEIMKKYLFVREQLKPYIMSLMEEAHEKNTPLMRAMFLEFPDDKNCWNVDYQYMFGTDLLVAPVVYAKQEKREVYLPEGHTWRDINTNKEYEGGQFVTVNCPIEIIPVFAKDGSDLLKNI